MATPTRSCSWAAASSRPIPAWPRTSGHCRHGGPRATIRVIEPPDLPGVLTGDDIVMPDEEITRDLARQLDLGEGRAVAFDRTFLRWDREWAAAQAPVA